MTDQRWQLLENARTDLMRTFASDGVIRVEYVAAFAQQDHFAVWLGAVTDAEAERLRQDQGLAGRVHAVLQRTGFTDAQLVGLIVVTQSQETVDRDYEGSWFYALR